MIIGYRPQPAATDQMGFALSTQAAPHVHPVDLFSTGTGAALGRVSGGPTG
jgi:hypothetical protein